MSDGYINLYLEYYNNDVYYDIQGKDMKYFNIFKLDDIDKLDCYASQYSLTTKLRYNGEVLTYGRDYGKDDDSYINIEDEDFFDKHLFVYIGYTSGNERFKNALSQYINKGYKNEGRIKASTLIDNPNLFMKAYEKIKERF